jgi:hypothetical protein
MPEDVYDDFEVEETTAIDELDSLEAEEDLEALIPRDIGDVSEGVAHRPTLVIGLGGAGCEAVLRAKKKLLSRFGELQTMAFLFMDTDVRTFAKMPGLPKIETNERIYIGGEHAIKAYRNKRLYPEIAARIPDELNPEHLIKLADGKGAGQIRVAGALCFLSSFDHIRTKIEEARNQIQTKEALLQDRLGKKGLDIVQGDVVVYMVGSLAGGTGCGTFLDTAALVSELVKSSNPNVVGIFMLPEAFFERVRGDQIQMQRMQANCYAALKEIQFFLDTKKTRPPVTFAYPNCPEITITGELPLWDMCYLVDFKDEYARRLSKLEDLYDVVGRQLFHEMGSPFGAKAESFANNATALSGIAACPETKKQRKFSTFSTACLSFPAERITSYCARRTLERFCDEVLLGEAARVEDIDKDVTAFLSSNGLEERGSSDQVLDALLTGSAGQASSDDYGLSVNFGRRKSAQEFSALIAKKKQEFETTDIPDLRIAIEENYRELLPGKVELIRSQMCSVFGTHGTRYCLQFLDHLALAFESMRDEMVDENRQWRDRLRQNTESAMDEDLSNLRKLWSVMAMLTSRDENLKMAIVQSFNQFVDGEILSLARDNAQAMFDQLEAAVHRERQRVVALHQAADGLGVRLRNAIAQVEASGRRRISDFVVELDVTDPGYDKTYYESKVIVPEEVLADCNEQFGNLYEALTGRDVRGMAARLLPICRKFYKQDLEQTNIIEFMKKQTRGGKKNAETKLEEIFEMCQPFWLTDIPGNAMYSDYIGLGAMPMDKRKLKFDPIIASWARKYQDFRTKGAIGRAEPVPTSIPYEIELSRRTHGARAYYLRDAKNWRKYYKDVVKAGTYPLHAHPDLSALEDLFPDLKAESKVSFAVAMAFGFIAKRGNHYYYNLEVKRDGHGGLSQVTLVYDSDWSTITQNIFTDPARAGDAQALGGFMKLAGKRAKPPKDKYLGNGREKALAAFMDSEPRRQEVDETYSSYVALMGQVNVTKDLEWYQGELDRMDVPRELRAQLRREKNAIAGLVDELRK